MSHHSKLADPKVSIITITHNREDYIREAIDSVLSQSFTDWELIIIDDALQTIPSL